jgi:hypothetical protein
MFRHLRALRKQPDLKTRLIRMYSDAIVALHMSLPGTHRRLVRLGLMTGSGGAVDLAVYSFGRRFDRLRPLKRGDITPNRFGIPKSVDL